MTVGSTGNRGFASNQANVIWQDTAGVAPVEPFAAAARCADRNKTRQSPTGSPAVYNADNPAARTPGTF